MKTQRNNTWMRFLITGLITSFIALSCDKRVEWIKHAEFYFVNTTSYTITYSSGFEAYNLSPNSTIIIKQTQGGSEFPKAIEYHAPFISEIGYQVPKIPLVIKFDNKKCIVIKDDTGANNPLNINSYKAERTDKRKFKFTYTFTEEDYNRATDCP